MNIARTKYGTVYRHGGFPPGYNSVVAYYPGSGIAVAIQFSADDTHPGARFDAMIRIIIKALLKNGERFDTCWRGQ